MRNGQSKSPPPKVLVLADGSSIHTQRWLEGLSQSGRWTLHLLSMNPAPIRPEIYKIPNVGGVHQIAPKKINEAGNNFQYLYQIPAMKRKIREINPAIISAVYLPSYGFVGALLKGSAKLVQFIVGGDVMIFPDQGWANKAVTKFTLSRSDFVVSASETMSSRIVDGFSYDRARILTQQYGLPDWVIEFPEPEKKYTFVSNRAWVPNSNIEYILEILAKLPNTTTAVIGSSVVGSETLGNSILLAANKIAGCELVGTMPYKENIGVVAESRFLVSLTSSDGASLSVMEAMAVGTIPIVSDIEPNREWIEHGVNGFLIPLDNPAEAVKRFQTALKLSKADQDKIIKKNKKIISARGSLSKNMNRVGEVFHDLERA